MPAQFQVVLERIKPESNDAFSFFFRRDSQFDYLPGQYLKLSLPIKHPDARGSSRFFTIASSPTEKNYIMITARILQSSFKIALHNLKPGDTAQMMGPFGRFVADSPGSYVFLAGGIGITPFRSMVIFTRDKKLHSDIKLFASFRKVDDLVFFDELSKVASDYPRFQFIPTITQPEECKNWQGEMGRIDKEKIKRYIENIDVPMYYIAGPQTMVDLMFQLVQGLGVVPDHLKKEHFPGY